MDELSETVRVWAVHTYMHMYEQFHIYACPTMSMVRVTS